ncbi:MAG: hypothetical protein QGH40_04555 [bacterium]|nr:hypothetical protein [bacterium]
MRTFHRAMIITVLLMVIGVSLAGAVTELPKDSWVNKAVKHLSIKGVFTGVPISAIQGERLLTRYEVAVLLARAIDRLGDREAYVEDADMQLFEKLLMEFSEDMQDLDVKVVSVRRYLELDELKARVATLEAQQSVSSEQSVGSISGRGARFKLKGEIEVELVDANGGIGADKAGVQRVGEPNPHLQLDKLVLQPEVQVSDSLDLSAQIYVTEDKAYLNEFHVKLHGFTMLGSNPWLDVGLYERWPKDTYSRKSEGYSLPGTAFFLDDAMTVSIGSEFGPVYWTVSAGSGYELALHEVAEDGGIDQMIIHDDHATSGMNEETEYGINIGLAYSGLDVYGFYYRDRLSSADITNLKSWLSGYTSGLDDKSRVGVGANYEFAGWKLSTVFVKAEDGACDRTGLAVEFSKHLAIDGHRWFTGLRPLVGFSTLDIDDNYDRDPDKPASWDREKTIVGVIFDLTENTSLKTEYAFNKEWTGGSREITNDEACLQLEVKF